MEINKLTVYQPPITRLSPERQRHVDMVREMTLANADIIQAYFDKIDKFAQYIKDQEATVIYTPRTVIDTSAPTCATRFEAGMYTLIAGGYYRDSTIVKIINPATGTADEVFKEIVMERYRKDLNKSRETTVAATYGIAHEALPGACVLERFRKDKCESREIVDAYSSVPTTNGGGAASGDN